MIAEKDFHRVITLERKRTELTRKPFLLMLLDMGGCIPSEKAETILSALSGFTRETDVTGWYTTNSVLGVICTEFGSHDRNTILKTMMTKLSESFGKNLSERRLGEMCITFHFFPEEWNHDVPQRPTDPDAPIHAPRKPRPHLRSGGAAAVPEPDDAQQVSSDNSFIRVARSSVEDSYQQGKGGRYPGCDSF
jgi:hypothetical protein